MELRKLSNTGLEVSKLALGTMNFGEQVSEQDAHEQMDYATGNGINFIDTAEAYPIPPSREKQGITEDIVGNWLKKSGKREELIIASKPAGFLHAGTIARRDATQGHTKANILKAIDGTLSRLQINHVDLYQVHAPDRITNNFGVRGVEQLKENNAPLIEETLDGLNEVVKAGKVRFIGISNESPWGISEYLRVAREKNYPRIVSIQNQYSITNRTVEIGISEMCLRENIAFLAYSPISGGSLSGKYLGGVQPAGARHTISDRTRNRYNGPHIQAAIQAYVELAKKHGLDPVHLALAFVNDRPFVTSDIFGATSMEQLKSDIASADITLSPEIMSEIKTLYTSMPDPQA